MTVKQKQTFIDEYNAAELLYNTALIDENVYRKIEHTLLRTIIGHLAIECNKISEIPTGSDVIWHDKRNYSQIVVKPQESEDKK